MDKEKIHQLAISYFEGRISLEDESILFDFISQSDNNTKLLKEWERNWMLTLNEEYSFGSEWNSLQAKIETRKAVAPILKPKAKLISIYRKIAAVAAIVIITVASTLIINNISSPAQENRAFIVETPNGEKSRVILPDGSIVWLNSTSRISYNSQFGSSDRNVILDGEAYFEVAKKEDLPFVVTTSDYDIVVKGTKFNVSSYHDDMKITTTLMEGKVDIVRNNKVLNMNPGESVQLDIKTDKFSKTLVNPEQYKSWIANKIEYDAIPLEELLNRLSRQYNVNIHLQTNQTKTRVLNISIKNDESIEEILQGLDQVTPMNIEYKGQDIYIKLK
ncbi:FecR family protein [Dysgonomonas sp. Marseille-P4677]|uniref:FecR family protein n=1 Tax=Dysgonomonas sp. Marseille-P4677 TaxID=2364790 RepID=UPI001911FF07|nr:FecR family protein [Dysgonomonas sp. Marseille-P4677]MBK5722188.1 FecR family protein [Dysgonomonas sp. Marseille-P4677]